MQVSTRPEFPPAPPCPSILLAQHAAAVACAAAQGGERAVGAEEKPAASATMAAEPLSADAGGQGAQAAQGSQPAPARAQEPPAAAPAADRARATSPVGSIAIAVAIVCVALFTAWTLIKVGAFA